MDDEVPALFATHAPASGLAPDLQAIAALIDEEDEPAAASCYAARGKRKAASLGTAQVHLALTSCGAAAHSENIVAKRTKLATSSSDHPFVKRGPSLGCAEADAAGTALDRSKDDSRGAAACARPLEPCGDALLSEKG